MLSRFLGRSQHPSETKGDKFFGCVMDVLKNESNESPDEQNQQKYTTDNTLKPNMDTTHKLDRQVSQQTAQITEGINKYLVSLGFLKESQIASPTTFASSSIQFSSEQVQGNTKKVSKLSLNCSTQHFSLDKGKGGEDVKVGVRVVEPPIEEAAEEEKDREGNFNKL